jgi:hypothetical protein
LGQIHKDVDLRRAIQANFLDAVDALDTEDEAREQDGWIDNHMGNLGHARRDLDRLSEDDLTQVQKSSRGAFSRLLRGRSTADDALAKLFDQQPVTLDITSANRIQREPDTAASQSQTENMSTAVTPPRGPNFISWTHFNTHTVPASDNFVQEHHE